MNVPTNVDEDSLPGERFLRAEANRPLFSAEEEDIWESEPRQTASGWLRLILASACLAGAAMLTGHRFVNYVVHHVWNHSLNSPSALIVPVLAVQFLWIIAHMHTGGLIARLKLGLGAAAACIAIFAPSIQSLSLGGGRPFDLHQLGALALASWVFVDGWRDRRSNLRKLAAA